MPEPEPEPHVRHYPEVNADSLRGRGILDIIRTPINGIDRHPDTPWRRVSNLAVQAMYIDGTEGLTPSPYYQLTVHFKKDKAEPMGFALRQQQDETFEIGTVAGPDAGLVPLDAETSAIITRLLMESLQPEAG